MELQTLNSIPYHKQQKEYTPFLEANTLEVTLDEIRDQHLIPVFVKDNQPTISQADFISTAMEIVEELSNQDAGYPQIRVSHPVKGRIFEARNKKASELEEWEKTIYYERMAFIAELPQYKQNINGQELSMTFGGVKAYNQDNLNSHYGSIQRFHFFIGFKVKVCTNLCIWSDGYSGELKVRSMEELYQGIYNVINAYNVKYHADALRRFGDYSLKEEQFAKLIGKTRMYKHLPKQSRQNLPELLISDSQISSLTNAYYKDEYFKVSSDGTINLWNLYNLLTGSIKSSYIDTFLDRSVNAFDLVHGIANALEGASPYTWYID